MAIEFGPKLGFAVHADLNENWYTELTRLLRGLDALVQPSAIDNTLTEPPEFPGDGDVYIIASPASGDWSGHAGEVTRWSEKIEAWEFYAPQPGWLFYVVSLEGYLSRGASSWAVFPPEDAPEIPVGPTFSIAYMDGVLNEFATAMTHPDSTVGAAVGFPESTGKRYFELFSTPLAASSTDVNVGLVAESVLPSLESGSAWGGYWFPGGVSGTFTWSSFGVVTKEGSSEGTITGFDDTDIIGFAVDLDLGLIWPMINGVAVTGDPVAGTGGFDISGFGAVRPFVGSNAVGREITIIAGDGDLNYSVSGFTPWYNP